MFMMLEKVLVVGGDEALVDLAVRMLPRFGTPIDRDAVRMPVAFPLSFAYRHFHG